MGFSEDASRVISESDDRTVRQWDRETGRELSSEFIRRELPFDVSGDDEYAPNWVSCGDLSVGFEVDDSTLWIRQKSESASRLGGEKTGKPESYRAGGGIFSVCHLPDVNGVLLSVVKKNKTSHLQFFDLASRKSVRKVALDVHAFGALAVCERRSLIAIAPRYNWGVYLFDLESCGQLEFLPVACELECVAVSRCGNYLACGTEGGSIVTWQIGKHGDPVDGVELTEERLQQWGTDTGFTISERGLEKIPRPGSHYALSEWARYCIE